VMLRHRLDATLFRRLHRRRRSAVQGAPAPTATPVLFPTLDRPLSTTRAGVRRRLLCASPRTDAGAPIAQTRPSTGPLP
jgi:hypothetical protein